MILDYQLTKSRSLTFKYKYQDRRVVSLVVIVVTAQLRTNRGPSSLRMARPGTYVLTVLCCLPLQVYLHIMDDVNRINDYMNV